MGTKDNFVIGDRVVAIESYDGNESIIGKAGTIMYIDEYREMHVCFDEEIELGHTLGGRCEEGHGWHMPARCVELLVEPDVEVMQTISYDEVMA